MVSAASVLQTEAPHEIPARLQVRDSCATVIADLARARAFGRLSTRREHLLEGSVAVQGYGGYFQEYRRHPERKMLGPDGKPCRAWTRGLLQPRRVRAADELLRIGKESNRLAETPLPLELDDGAVVEYPGARVCAGCGAPLVRRQRKWCADRCRNAARRRGER
jgi:hypothetical protein